MKDKIIQIAVGRDNDLEPGMQTQIYGLSETGALYARNFQSGFGYYWFKLMESPKIKKSEEK